jgi:hypothetical protein
MNPEFTVSSVSERDVDRLLVEEFVCSDDFQNWFVGQALGPGHGVRDVHRVQHSIMESTGESDLEVTFTGIEGRAWRLLIGNKIAAPVQPQQVERYRLRGARYLERGECDAYRLVLVAPRRYFGNSEQHEGFDTRITYESLWEWFSGQDGLGERRAYKAGLLAAAIERAAEGYRPEEEQGAPTTDLWRGYWELAVQRAPELDMEEPRGKQKGSRSVHFHPGVFTRGVEIVHKFTQGCVDLQFGGFGRRLVELRVAFKTHLDADMQISQASKSGAIRIKVPRLAPEANFGEQRDRVEVGLAAAKRLFHWYENHAARWAAEALPQ